MNNFKYFPHTAEDIKQMLETIGVEKIDDLFSDIPKEVLVNEDIDLPSSKSELELRKILKNDAKKNKELICFLGAGSYDVYTPSVINTITSRQEFLTSYTPYQAEISQGTLQYIFEFQSMICELTKMDVANASLYDGATALAEAIFMATSHTKRKKVLVSKTINPRYLDVIKTYTKYRDVKIELIDEVDYCIDTQDAIKKLDDDVASIIVQNPNFYGVIENYDGLVDATKNNKSLFVMSVDPSTLSILKTPKEIGADIVCGDAQSLGIPLSFGGPYVGFMATTEKLMRKLPGRIVGMTVDTEDSRGYVLTIQAREQHIRREKATSNICSNQSLMALHTLIYTMIMGKQGLVEAAKRAYNNAHYLCEKLLETKKFTKEFKGEFFKEFVLKSKIDLKALNKYLEDKGYLGGLVLGKDCYLLCATEVRTKDEIDEFVRRVEEF